MSNHVICAWAPPDCSAEPRVFSRTEIPLLFPHHKTKVRSCLTKSLMNIDWNRSEPESPPLCLFPPKILLTAEAAAILHCKVLDRTVWDYLLLFALLLMIQHFGLVCLEKWELIQIFLFLIYNIVARLLYKKIKLHLRRVFNTTEKKGGGQENYHGQGQKQGFQIAFQYIQALFNLNQGRRIKNLLFSWVFQKTLFLIKFPSKTLTSFFSNT